ncbi:MAG: hypothetical protein DRI54_01215 [Bacteroidetes bacterium]|nr:MAG: hypothetical protein DRI54_01215 [Bacteroidota bacterium]
MITRTRLSYCYYSKLLILLIGFFGLQLSSFGQNTPQAINYQAVARDSDGIPLSEIVLNVELNIVQGNPNGNEVYAELHEVVTDVFGLFALKIGNGIVLDGVFSEIDWGSEITFLKVSIDAGQGSVELPTVQLLSVPYALHSANADSASYGADEDANPANELQTISKSDEMIVTLSNGGGTFTDEIDDADADPENELQELELNGQILTLSNDPSGTSVDLGAESSDDQQLAVEVENTNEVTLSLDSSPSATFSIIDADADSTNEFQTIEREGNTVTLSNNGGSFTDEVNDADADPANEIQTIDKNGNTVTLSNDGGSFTDEVNDADANPLNEIQVLSKDGNTVTLSKDGGTFTDDVNDADANPSNEIQVLSKVDSTVTLSNGGGTFIDKVDDADASPTNEQITTLTLSPSNLLEIQEGTNNQSVDLSSLKVDNSWTPNGNNIKNSNTGNVGINETSPTSTLFVNGSMGGLVRIEAQAAFNYVLGDESVFIGKPELGDVEVDLPKASTVPGRIYHIKNGSKNVASDVIIHAFAGDFINYETIWTLRTLDYSASNNTTADTQGITIISDGIDTWWIISTY